MRINRAIIHGVEEIKMEMKAEGWSKHSIAGN